jgi:hypothetical protein
MVQSAQRQMRRLRGYACASDKREKTTCRGLAYPNQSIGMHFGTFQLTTEAINQPRKDLTRALCQASILETEFVTLDEGETRIYRADLP